MSIETLGRISVSAFLPFMLAACTNSIERLDEAVVLDRPAMRLKVVRYYENMPWHYSGEIYVVQCATPHTRSMHPRTKTDEAGWREVERSGAIGSGSAREIAEDIKRKYRVIEDRAIVIVGDHFKATLDGCQTFVHWNGWDLPEDFVDQVPKPAGCADARPPCPWENFRGDRALQFSSVELDLQNGRISMFVDSRAFKNNKRLAVSSADGGKTWIAVPVDKETAQQGHAGDARNARA